MIWALIVIGIIALDQYTKHLAITELVKYDTLPLIESVFHLTFVENRGAAFGIMQNQRWFFIIITMIIFIVAAFYFIKYRPTNRLLLLSVSMIMGGALGNFVDRLRFGYVVDFLDFTLIKFPVFNIADSFIVIGTILMAYYVIFIHEENKGETNA